MLASPRSRRRLLKLTLLLVVAGCVAGSFVLWPNTADEEKFTSPVSDEPAVVPAEPESVPLTGQTRTAALETAKRFVQTAVVREHVAESWDLVHPDLRQGMTRREWSTGDIPVTPYPVDSARWRLGYSQAGAVGLEVYVLPKAGSDVRSMVFDIELKALGSGAARRWLVTSWAPRGGSILAQAPPSPRREAAEQRARERWDDLRLPAGLLLVPLGLIFAVFLLPLFIAGRDRHRRARAERVFSAHRDARREARRGPPTE